MSKPNSAQWLLLVAVFVIATCGLIYELVAGTLASYVLGDSITQFSTIIGVYLFAMGVAPGSPNISTMIYYVGSSASSCWSGSSVVLARRSSS